MTSTNANTSTERWRNDRTFCDCASFEDGLPARVAANQRVVSMKQCFVLAPDLRTFDMDTCLPDTLAHFPARPELPLALLH
jgi:hypothetical protein